MLTVVGLLLGASQRTAPFAGALLRGTGIGLVLAVAITALSYLLPL